jgi:preprotein translocase subunit SecA
MAFDWDKITDRLGSFGEGVGNTLKGVFGARNERMVKRLEPIVRQINQLETWAKSLTAEQFQEQTRLFKEQIAKGEKTLDDVLPQAFALAREASVRTLGHAAVRRAARRRHRAARGQDRRDDDGRGKTLVATLPLYLNALSGKTVYLVTVNDYLARRDANWMGPIYDYLGVAVASIQSDMSPWERQPVYLCDIVYGTNNEFGFDYLRDNMKTRAEEQVQKELSYAIVDEVDSILVDEARTPLIISGRRRTRATSTSWPTRSRRSSSRTSTSRSRRRSAPSRCSRPASRSPRSSWACPASSCRRTRTGCTSSRTRCARTTSTTVTRSTWSRATARS